MSEAKVNARIEIEVAWYRNCGGESLCEEDSYPVMLAAVLAGCGGGGSNPTEAALVVRGFLNALLDPSGEALIPA